MNSEQAKQIRIEEYLYRIGIMPVKERGCNLWYKSPFRNEDKPSFKVNRYLTPETFMVSVLVPSLTLIR